MKLFVFLSILSFTLFLFTCESGNKAYIEDTDTITERIMDESKRFIVEDTAIAIADTLIQNTGVKKHK